MRRSAILDVSADMVLITHVAFAAFVVVGLLLIVTGGFRKWHWVRNPWFRLAHMAAIAAVVVESWSGVACPLTTLEMSLRERAGEASYGGSCIAYWLQRLLYYEAPPWAFAVSYTLFGMAALGGWIAFRPRPFHSRARPGSGGGPA
jgi:Protein of Unknown function (DUF2784)